MSPVEYHAWTHRPKALGGTDPIEFPSGGTEVCHLFGWNFDTSNTIAASSWTNVANTTNDSYYEEVFTAPVGTTFTYDFDAGTIQLNDDAEYVVYGWVQLNETGSAGELRGVALNFGSSDRYINVVQADAIDAEYKIAVTAHRLVGFGTATVFLEVWHDSGSSRSIRDAELLVRRFETVADGEFTSRP